MFIIFIQQNIRKHMLTPDIDKLKPAQCREVVIKKRYPEF